MKARMAVAAGSLACAMGGLLLTGAPAAAAEGGQSCVVNLDDTTVTCAATEAQAMRAAEVAADLVIARFYDGTNYSGAVLTWVQSRACTSSYDSEWQWADLRSTSGGNWNNRVSSIRTYNRCDVKLYDGINFTGAASTWIDTASNLAAIGSGWSNRAGSVKFS